MQRIVAIAYARRYFTLRNIILCLRNVVEYTLTYFAFVRCCSTRSPLVCGICIQTHCCFASNICNESLRMLVGYASFPFRICSRISGDPLGVCGMMFNTLDASMWHTCDFSTCSVLRRTCRTNRCICLKATPVHSVGSIKSNVIECV